MSINQALKLRFLCSHASRSPKVVPHPLIRPFSSIQGRQWSTPLAKNLAEAITTTGPIPIAQYMRQCLTSPEGGYYTTRQAEGGKDQFGKTGDFVTSPEISQIFGELVGIWFLAEWMSQGRKSSGIQLLELGPGRGTLMDDVLRTISNFKAMASAIETIYLVEASAMLRNAQKELLCGDLQLEEHPMGHQCRSKRLPNANIVWVEDVKFIPQEYGKTPFIIAHEFFDALPIHAFQSVSPNTHALSKTRDSGITISTTDPSPQPGKPPQNEWRELLVSPTSPPSVISPPKEPKPEFELTLSPAPTHHSRLLPSLSPRYKGVLPSAGSTIEISPESLTTTTILTNLISAEGSNSPSAAQSTISGTAESKAQPSGAALIIDYGPSDTIPISSLRGIKSHTRCSPFAEAGRVDLSADVDFGALAETALLAAEDVEVHGPVEQADWLAAMGGRERCDVLVKGATAASLQSSSSGTKGGVDKAASRAAEELRERVEGGWKRLVERGPNGMGRLYKVMAIVPLSGGQRRPVGFGGDVMG